MADMHKSIIDYKDLNPLINWRISEIKDMLHAIKGYENIQIVFYFQGADNWKKDHWDCKCGIQEGNVWILQYQFRIEDRDEPYAKIEAWDLMTKKLITDVWRTAIDSFKKQSNGRYTNV